MDQTDKERTKNLAAGGKFRLDEIPIRKFYEQAQYLDSQLLPKLAQTRGKTHPDYIFFESVYKSLLYAIMILDRDLKLVRQLQQITQLAQLHKDRADLAERELQKYTTMEDLIFTNGLDTIAKSVVQRVNDLLTNK